MREGWRGKEGGSDFRVIFRDGFPRNVLELKRDPIDLESSRNKAEIEGKLLRIYREPTVTFSATARVFL